MQSIFAETALLSEGWRRNVAVLVDAEGRIGSVAAETPEPEGSRHVRVLLPALSNLHSHTFQRAMAGLSEARSPAGRDSFWSWRAIMYRFLDVLTPEEIETIAAFAFMEMQEAGFAAVAEFHYLHNQPGGAPYDDPAELSARIAAAAATTGIGLTLLPVHYAQGGVDGRPLAGGQLRFGNDCGRFLRLLEGARSALRALPADTQWGVAPHSLRAVGRADLARLAQYAPEHPLHMHIAEQEKEIEETLSVFGERPVRWLLDNHDVGSNWCLIHCTHMEADETGRLAASGAVAGLCPVTEGNLGDGVFDGVRFLASGGALGVGSDSNIRISACEELRQLEYSQRLRDRLRVVLAGPGASAGRTLYDGAVAGGARALGRAGGVIAPGMWADLVALDPQRSGLAALDEDSLLDGWIFAGSNDMVGDVWSAGRHMVQGGRHCHREPIARAYGETLSRIMPRL